MTGVVSNTVDEAREVKQLFDENGFQSIILVTSSFHMPRAKLVFDKAGVISETYPSDFKAANNNITWLSFIPSARAFYLTSSGIREFIGRFYYWMKFM